MRQILDYGWRLMLVCAVASGILAVVYSTTKPKILANEEKKYKEELTRALPEVTKFEVIKSTGLENCLNCMLGYKNEKLIGSVFEIEEKGYGGPMRMLVGVKTNCTIARVIILSHKETPGLGKKAEEEFFRKQFVDKRMVALKKDNLKGTIDAITGATITSRAVTNGVQKALNLAKNVTFKDLNYNVDAITGATVKNYKEMKR